MPTIALAKQKIYSKKQALCAKFLDQDPEVTEVLFGGAAGGGKSFLLCLWQIMRRVNYPETRGFIGRYTFRDLEDTTMKTFLQVWETIGQYNPKGVTMRIVGHDARFSNGSEIMFRWLRQRDVNVTNLGSLELTDACIDEVTEISKKTKDILAARIRFKLINKKPALLMACNPAANWVREEYVQDNEGNPVDLPAYKKFVPASVLDNPNKEFAKQYEKELLKLSPSEQQRLLLGQWDFVQNEEPFFHHFGKRHIFTEVPFEPFEPLYLSWDFNIQPTTCVVGQKLFGHGIVIHATHQEDGGSAHLARKLADEFRYQDHQAGILFTGDFYGYSRTSVGGLNEYGEYNTDYSNILNAFSMPDTCLIHTTRYNPRIVYSARMCNQVLFRDLVMIKKSTNGSLIRDLNTAQKDDRGKLIKNRRLGMGMDAADAYRYFNHMCFPEGFKEINQFAESINIHKSNR